MVHSFLISFAERSQDSTAAVLSDSSSTQDMFNEPASSQDSLRKTYTEKRISTTCADTLMPSKETLGSTEEKSMPDLIMSDDIFSLKCLLWHAEVLKYTAL